MDVPNEVEKINEVLDKILPERDLNLVTIKSVRKDVADYLKVDESYFTDNKEKKAILKDILKDKLLKLYNEQQGKKEEHDDESTKTKSSNESEDEYIQKKHNKSNKSIKSDSKNNKKRKMSSDDFNTPSSKNAKKEKKNGNKKDDNSDNDNDELKPKSRKKSSGSITEKNVHTIKKEKLRKIVLDLKIGPTIFKDLNKENDEEYNKKLEEKIIAFCEKKEICSEKNRLPNPSEIQEYAKQLKLKEELDGIDLSNILDSGTRSRRRAPNVYTSKIIEGSEDEEEEDEEDDDDDDEEKNEEDDEEDDEEEDDEDDEEEEDEDEEEEEDEDEEEYEEEEDDDDDDD